MVSYSPGLAKKQTYEINRQVEKARRLRLAAARRSEYGDSAKFVTFAPVDGEGEVRDDARVVATLNHEAIERARSVAGYNMIVTSEAGMSAREICDTYRQLWRIGESFRVMKSDLDARPVYLQRRSSITGHFLVCCIAVLLMRLLQAKVLGDEFCSEEVVSLFRGLNVCRASERRYVNVSRRTPIIEDLAGRTGLPLLHFNLTKGEVKSIAGCTLTMLQGKGKSPSASKKAARGTSQHHKCVSNTKVRSYAYKYTAAMRPRAGLRPASGYSIDLSDSTMSTWSSFLRMSSKMSRVKTMVSTNAYT